MKRNLMKTRSWELTIDEIKEKQKQVRKNMWMVFIVFIVAYVSSFGIYLLGYKQSCLMFMGVAIMLLILLVLSKYFEISLSTIIEIRMLKEKDKP